MALVTPQQLENASADSNTISDVTNGDENTTVTSRLGRVFPTLAKTFADWARSATVAITSLAAFNYRGDWAAGTAYAPKDVVRAGDPSILYATGSTHVAGANFAADLAAGKWAPYQTQTYRVTIQDLGGAGDYNPAIGVGRNNFLPMFNYTSLFNDGPTIHFPFVTGQSNIYYFASESPYSFLPGTVRITRDPGVRFYGVNVGFDVEIDGVIEAIPNGIVMGMTYIDEGNHAFPQPLRDKTRAWIGQGDLTFVHTRRATPETEFQKCLMFWPGSFESGGSELEFGRDPTSVTLDSTKIMFASAGSGVWEGAGFRMLVGQRISGRFFSPVGNTGIRSAVFARTANGYFGISSGGNGTSATYEKEAGKVQIQGGFQYPQNAYRQTHATFDMDKAVVTVVLVNAYTVQILVNGALFYRRVTPDPIQEIFFGGFIAGPNAGAYWTDFLIEEGAAQNSTDLIGLFYVGDSRQAEGGSAPARYACEYIDGSLGARVFQYRNQAVAGHNSFDQLAILQANGVPAGTTDMVLAWGTNDIQNATVNPIDFYNNTIAAIQIGKAAGVNVVIDIPPLWYGQDQAGARGQAAIRYDQGSPVRMALMRAAAAEGVPTVDMLSEPGLLVANMVNPLQVPDLTWMDPMIPDNIHGNPTLAKIQGFAHAKAILGQRNKVSNNKVDWRLLPPVWIPQSGYQYTTDGSHKFRVNDAGDVEFRIDLDMPANRDDGTIIHSVGRLLAPPDPIEMSVYTNLHERGSVVLGKDGYYRIYGLEASTGTKLRVNSGLYSTMA